MSSSSGPLFAVWRRASGRSSVSGPSRRSGLRCCRPTAWPSSCLAVPRQQIGRAIGIQGAAQAIGLALGPSVGGLLLAAGGWRLIFLVNVPFGLLGMVAGVLFVPRSRHLQERVRFDWTGLALFVPAVTAVMCAISFGDAWGWGSPAIIGLVVGTAVLGRRFVAHERRAAHPMIDPELFRSARFSAGIVAGLLSYLVLFGVLLLVPFYLERARHSPRPAPASN